MRVSKEFDFQPWLEKVCLTSSTWIRRRSLAGILRMPRTQRLRWKKRLSWSDLRCSSWCRRTIVICCWLAGHQSQGPGQASNTPRLHPGAPGHRHPWLRHGPSDPGSLCSGFFWSRPRLRWTWALRSILSSWRPWPPRTCMASPCRTWGKTRSL